MKIMKIQLLLLGAVLSLISFTDARAESKKPKVLWVAEQTSTPSLEEKVAPRSASRVSLGVMAGLDLASTNIGIDNSNLSVNSGDRTGFAGGVLLEIGLSEIFAIEPEVLYIQKGGVWTLKNDKVSLHYDCLEIPVLAKFKIGSETAKAVLFAGPHASVAVNKTSETNTKSNPLDDANNFDFGLHMGAGGQFAVSQRTSLFANGRYMAGLLNLSKVDGFTANLRGFLFLTGVSFGL